MSAAFLHTFGPFALRLGESFGIRWYGLAYLAGFLTAYLILTRLAKLKQTAFPVEQAGDFVFAMALGIVIGGRLGFCAFYEPSLFLKFSAYFPFWGVLEIHKGGMASHGGIIGVIIAALIFAGRNNLPALHLLDLLALTSGAGLFFGRLANFINAELVGRPAPPGLAWAVKFPQDILTWPLMEPQRLKSLVPVIQALGPGYEGVNESILHTIRIEPLLERIVQAVQYGNSAVTRALEPLLTARHPSQIYEALLEGALVFAVMQWLWRRKPAAGVLSASFVILYSLARIFCEQFRMPDIGIGFQLFGLTRGQWLTLPALVFGIVMLCACLRGSSRLTGTSFRTGPNI